MNYKQMGALGAGMASMGGSVTMYYLIPGLCLCVLAGITLAWSIAEAERA